MIITQTFLPGYQMAIQDAVEIIDNRLALASHSGELTLLKVLASEVSSLHQNARAQRTKTKADKLESIVDNIASQVVQAAIDDYELGLQRREKSKLNDSAGNVCAQVCFSFPATVRWLDYAAQRGDTRAMELLRIIAAQRSPMQSPEERQNAIEVHRISIPQD